MLVWKDHLLEHEKWRKQEGGRKEKKAEKQGENSKDEIHNRKRDQQLYR